MEIRLGMGEKGHYVSLRDYYDKNWATCTDMWAFYGRRNLPDIGDENTNNRLERTWRSMKDYLKLLSYGLVNIYKAIMYLTKWAEEQLEERYTWALRHRMRIWDADPDIRKLYEEAAEVLNDTGCLKFKASVEMLREREMFLSLEAGGGVMERRKNQQKGESKPRENVEVVNDDRCETDNCDDNQGRLYSTTTTNCNCLFFVKHSCPCRHVLYLRKSCGLPLFDIQVERERERERYLSPAI